ncbi:hypothetical protein N0V88_005540 [Collariella sp. IMI 366227]|nr:hypothetical protein N0V88_005540 [Collariella sp. IMI 366227]
MLSQSLLLALAGTAAAYYELVPGGLAMKRDLMPRETDTPSDECLEAVQAVITLMPTSPTELNEFYATMSDGGDADPCKITYPPPVESAFSSYMSEISSWWGENSDEFSAALSKCPEGQSTEYDLQAVLTCDGSENGAGGAGAATTTSADKPAETGGSTGGTDSGSGSGNDNNNNNNNNNGGDKNAAHRETGFMGAAVALAGVLGAVIAL